jgi:uncharacterized membrane protein YqhA
MKKLIGFSRYLVILAVISAFAASVALLAFGVYETGSEILKLISGEAPKSVAAKFIELADLYLLGVVMFIIAIGLYELFIDDTIPTPAWLEIHHIDDLKGKLVSVIIVVLAVSFLKQVVAWDKETNLLTYGGGVGIIIAALTYFLGMKSKH